MESDLKPTFQKGFAMNANFVNQLAKHSSSVSEQTKVFAGLKYRKVLLMFRTNQIGEKYKSNLWNNTDYAHSFEMVCTRQKCTKPLKVEDFLI